MKIQHSVAVCLFLVVLGVSVRFGVAWPWYPLLMVMMFLLFGKDPQKNVSSFSRGLRPTLQEKTKPPD